MAHEIRKATDNSTLNTLNVGDIGSQIFIDCGEDLTDAENLALNMQKPGPSGATELLAGTLTVDPENNKRLKYITVDGDVNLAGVYKVQPQFDLEDFTGSYPIFEFCVNPIIVVT